MRTHRKAASPAPVSASTDISRKINALVFLLEEKGVLKVGEFEDATMNLKVQLGDQVPANGRARPTGSGASPGQNQNQAPGHGRRGGGNDYIGPERRRQLDSEREGGQDRRDSVRAAVAHIAGEVVNESDRHPVSGVQLILRRSSLTNPAIQFRSTKTDMQGRFVFLNLPLGKEAEPDSPYTYLLEVRYRNRTIYNNTDVHLQAGQTNHHMIQVPQLEDDRPDTDA